MISCLLEIIMTLKKLISTGLARPLNGVFSVHSNYKLICDSLFRLLVLKDSSVNINDLLGKIIDDSSELYFLDTINLVCYDTNSDCRLRSLLISLMGGSSDLASKAENYLQSCGSDEVGAIKNGNLPLLKALIELGHYKEGKRLLHTALTYKNNECIDYLILNQIDMSPTITDSNNRTLMHLSIVFNRLDVFMALLESDDSFLFQKDINGYVPLDYYFKYNFEFDFNALLKQVFENKNKSTMLHFLYFVKYYVADSDKVFQIVDSSFTGFLNIALEQDFDNSKRAVYKIVRNVIECDRISDFSSVFVYLNHMFQNNPTEQRKSVLYLLIMLSKRPQGAFLIATEGDFLQSFLECEKYGDLQIKYINAAKFIVLTKISESINQGSELNMDDLTRGNIESAINKLQKTVNMDYVQKYTYMYLSRAN